MLGIDKDIGHLEGHVVPQQRRTITRAHWKRQRETPFRRFRRNVTRRLGHRALPNLGQQLLTAVSGVSFFLRTWLMQLGGVLAFRRFRHRLTWRPMLGVALISEKILILTVLLPFASTKLYRQLLPPRRLSH